MWSEENFTRIVLSIGQLIGPMEIPLNLQDVSHGKICILTDKKTKINEEVLVESNGNIQKVGLVEYDFDWSPFPAGPWISLAFIDDEDDNLVIGDTLDDDNASKGPEEVELEEG
ncbi:unnamed protein product [Lactuca virosa]|uniref:Uncharacterized protein n=1 Tax=Lactuca virosa TaxID=75947 RepID=A0AAU9LHT8_9ASTR|nr:unnamed protein product [Lactuca virosa]